MVAKVFVILGPTCTGKTSLAIQLCKQFNGSIVSADSRQVVRHMDIGTGKIPVEENSRSMDKLEERWVMDGVDVFGYDLVNPDEYFSAFDYVSYFRSVTVSKENIFVVGGTGFYIDALMGRVSIEGAGPDMKLRKKLEKLTVEELAERLLTLNEAAYKKIDLKNPARLRRAIEKSMQRKPSELSDPVVKNPIFLGLTAARETLYTRSDAWVDSIFNEQLFDEVKAIQKLFPKSHRLNGLIYKNAVDYLAGVGSLEECRQKAKFGMHAYIRRQQTWFKRNQEINWFDISHQNFDADISSIVESALNG